jgi:hypothetical protein
MAKRKTNGGRRHGYRDKLILNQWLISLFDIDPLFEYKDASGRKVRPFHKLAEHIRDPLSEGLDESNTHKFFYKLTAALAFTVASLSRAQIRIYEDNICQHTQTINEKRHRPVTWKYFQWLTLLFTEIYLDRYFTDRFQLLDDLNGFLVRFNKHWEAYEDVEPFSLDDLNKLSLQNATGSGKTLIMHVNLLQFRHYARKAGREAELSRVILLTPNERLSEQHLKEFRQSGIQAQRYIPGRDSLFSAGDTRLKRVDVMEITKLADSAGPNTEDTRNLGRENLLLVDEGHRGMSGKEEGAWIRRRNMLCERGFTFEYSATFAQSVTSAKDKKIEDSYAKCTIFDYSYRWFYEDGFGKDYQILNLAKGFDQVQSIYLTACLLKFYQQLRIYEAKKIELIPFNIEKPLWVFVGSSVVKATGSKEEQDVASDVANIIRFLADFLSDRQRFIQIIEAIIVKTGQDTGLVDENGYDIFAKSFDFLTETLMMEGQSAAAIYQDILFRLFNNPAGGRMRLARIKGDSGEIALHVGATEEPFGLINVGDALGLCKNIEGARPEIPVTITESDFADPLFAGVNESSSPVNVLIGSKKFVEGWDCWRVSTMGLMHVGKSEGAQIIQLFGRGVRLKGYAWNLKRSGHIGIHKRPEYIEELERLNVFGIEADFMQKFKDFLKEEGLPGNERKEVYKIPLNITYDIGKKLKIVRPKKKRDDGQEYSFKNDGPVPCLGELTALHGRINIDSDWYPRIQLVQSKGKKQETAKDKATLNQLHLSFLNIDELYFELEQYKRMRGWYNLNISKAGIKALLQDTQWYTLWIPAENMLPTSYSHVKLWQQISIELLKRYCDRFYDLNHRAFIEPRLEIRELKKEDDNFPNEKEGYRFIVDASESDLIRDILQIQKDLKVSGKKLLQAKQIVAHKFDHHLYEPLFHIRKGATIKVSPVALNQSEYDFVMNLHSYCAGRQSEFKGKGLEVYLLRNLSRGKGVGFFEAGGFYPDFILWLIEGSKQYISFVEPHGLRQEGPNSKKIEFHKTIKEIEKRLGDPNVILNSFILSWTKQRELEWGLTEKDFENVNVLFMGGEKYIDQLFDKMRH